MSNVMSSHVKAVEKKSTGLPISKDDQFKFLFSCIHHGDHGKIDFEAVAKECSIVSKGAA
ncbi:MAG: hypothetical protein Q9221_007428 [Calogaya cf. arnoldii]